jgi:fructan beta-fructosidase
MKNILFFSLLSFSVFAQTTHWRPKIHFAPQKNWTNDPNGLVYHEGEWHLFFQYNPEGDKWGNMSWGHAISTDLSEWIELPVAIPQDSVWIFSGCVVVDKDNTAGFGKNAMVAIYTADYHGKKENQHLAFSTDKGRTWTKYFYNPIISQPFSENSLPKDAKDFRDPNVIWHESSKQWILTVALPKEFKVQFYGSKNLKNWTFLSEFGQQGDMSKMWECPSLFQSKVDGSQLAVGNEQTSNLKSEIPNLQSKFILLLSSSGSNPDYVGMQYFVGEFDGKTFKNLNPADTKLYLDYGRDYYAAIPFHNATDGRNITLGWMSSWQYAGQLPTSPYRGQMTLPKEIILKNTSEGLRLYQLPTKEILENPRWTQVMQMDGMLINDSTGDAMTWRNQTDVFKMEIEMEPLDAKEFGLKLFQKQNTLQETVLSYNADNQLLNFNRINSGSYVSGEFHTMHGGNVKLEKGLLKLLIIADKSSVEVFINDGKMTMTNLVFPAQGSNDWQVFSQNGKIRIKTVKIWEMY